MFSNHGLLAFGFGLSVFCGAVHSAECDSWQTRRPDWIFCDDFEKSGPLVSPGRYFEHDNNKGDFNPAAGAGMGGSVGMRARWQAGEVEAGNLKVSFGRAPGAYFAKGIRPDDDFREVYYRMFVRMQKGWVGNPYKLSRATVMAKSDWSQAMIAHLWGDDADHLKLDPVNCTDASGNVKCNGYNDFDNMSWIGAKAGPTPLFSGNFDEKWVCVETRVRLNTAGKSDGVHEYWINDTLEASREGLNFVGKYTAYGINSVFFENHWNSGSPKLQDRFFDNIVVSTARIGCKDNSGPITGIRVLPERKVPMGIAGFAGIQGLGGKWEGAQARSLDGRGIPASVGTAQYPPGMRIAPGYYIVKP